MTINLASSWCATDLGPYRPCEYTYERYPLGSVPSVFEDLDGFRWLGGRVGHRVRDRRQSSTTASPPR